MNVKMIHVVSSKCLLCCSAFLGHKRVSFEEFLPCFLSCNSKKEQGSMEDFVEGLKVFDKDGNGFINSAELRHVLTSLGKQLDVGCSPWQPREREGVVGHGCVPVVCGLVVTVDTPSILPSFPLSLPPYSPHPHPHPHPYSPGEKLTDEEVDALLSGVEDSQGQVNYEGM